MNWQIIEEYAAVRQAELLATAAAQRRAREARPARSRKTERRRHRAHATPRSATATSR